MPKIGPVQKLLVRQATLEDLPRIAHLAKFYQNELGFIPTVQLQSAIEKSELLIEETSTSFCKYHLRSDGWKVIYSILVPLNHQGKGIGKALVAQVGYPCRAKCPADLQSNSFYLGVGFRLVSRERSAKRILNVWEKEQT